MDKINRAMCLAEDNAVHIDDTARRLRARTRAYCIDGETRTVDGKSVTAFGTVDITGDCAVTVVFDGAPCALTLGGNTLAEGSSPLIAAPPCGRGSLALGEVRSGAHALVFGAVTVS